MAHNVIYKRKKFEKFQIRLLLRGSIMDVKVNFCSYLYASDLL